MTAAKEFVSLRLANIERNQYWDPDNKLTALFHATELGGECGEALNVVKKLERERLGLRGSRASVDQLGEELADVIICTDLLAQRYSIPLLPFVVHKFNKSSAANNLPVLLRPGPGLII